MAPLTLPGRLGLWSVNTVGLPIPENLEAGMSLFPGLSETSLPELRVSPASASPSPQLCTSHTVWQVWALSAYKLSTEELMFSNCGPGEDS